VVGLDALVLALARLLPPLVLIQRLGFRVRGLQRTGSRQQYVSTPVLCAFIFEPLRF